MHPDTMYELAKLKIADELCSAERERLVRQAGETKRTTIDAVPFRERVSRLFGGWPSTNADSIRPAGA
jgi:hypothetical protein